MFECKRERGLETKVNDWCDDERACRGDDSEKEVWASVIDPSVFAYGQSSNGIPFILMQPPDKEKQ